MPERLETVGQRCREGLERPPRAGPVLGPSSAPGPADAAISTATRVASTMVGVPVRLRDAATLDGLGEVTAPAPARRKRLPISSIARTRAHARVLALVGPRFERRDLTKRQTRTRGASSHQRSSATPDSEGRRLDRPPPPAALPQQWGLDAGALVASECLRDSFGSSATSTRLPESSAPG